MMTKKCPLASLVRRASAESAGLEGEGGRGRAREEEGGRGRAREDGGGGEL